MLLITYCPHLTKESPLAIYKQNQNKTNKKKTKQNQNKIRRVIFFLPLPLYCIAKPY